MHDQRSLDRDVGGKNVLVSSDFYYFGCEAIAIPSEFRSLIPTTQGHKNTCDLKLIKRFWSWLEATAPRRGRIGLPAEFDGDACGIPQGAH
jgi:hypothetical protein